MDFTAFMDSIHMKCNDIAVVKYFLHSASEMTCIVSSGALNSTHSLTGQHTMYDYPGSG